MMRWVREAYWSPLGDPIRSFVGTAVPSANAKDYWDGLVSGQFAARIGPALGKNIRNSSIIELLRFNKISLDAVLDLGCGEGSLAPYLFAADTAHYCGVDISELSITSAKSLVTDSRAEFIASALDSFTPQRKFDVIVMSEVLYYLDFNQVANQVSGYSQHLAPNGVFCVSMIMHPKGRAVQRQLMKTFDYVHGVLYQEKLRPDTKTRHNPERPPYHIFLMRPRPR